MLLKQVYIFFALIKIEINSVYDKSNRYQEGLDCYEISLKQNPNDLELLINKGNALAGIKQFEQAINCYDHVIKINDKFALAYQNKGDSFNELYRTKKLCFNEFEKVLQKLSSNNIMSELLV